MKNKLVSAPGLSWIAMLLIWMAASFNSGCREIMNKLMPEVINYFGLSASTAGLLGTVGTVAGGVCVLFLTAWADKRGIGYNRWKPQIALAAVYLLFTMLIGVPAFGSLAFLFIFQFIRFGAAQGGEAIDNAAAVEWFPKESRVFALNAEHTMYPWGSMLVCLIATGIFALTDDWKMAFILVPIIAIPFWAAYIIFAKKSRFEKMNKKMLEMGLTPSLTVEEVEQHAAATTKEKSTESIWSLFKNKNVLAAFLLYALILGAYFGVNWWLANFLAFQCGFDTTRAASYSVLFGITSGIGMMVWGAFADKKGSKKTIMICCIWLGISFCFLPLMRQGLLFVVLVQLVFGFCMNAAFPTCYSLAGDSVKKEQLGQAIGICDFACIIAGCYPFISGIIIDMFGGFESYTGFIVVLAFYILSIVAALLVCILMAHEVTGPKRGRDWALTSYEACGITPAKDDE